MARRIVDAGYPLTIWARRPESLEPYADSAATVAATPAELGTASDIVCICVVADADVEDVILRDDGVLAGMSPGSVIAIHATVHPDTCRRIAAAIAGRGVAVVDVPVSGGGGAAAEQRLLVMAGGAVADVERCRPIFATFANPVIYLGPLGSGQLAKVLNNFVFTAQMSAAMDTYAFAEQLGMDRTAVAQVLASGSGGSRAAAIFAASGFDDSGIRMAAGLLRKDVGILSDVAATAGADVPSLLLDLANRTITTFEGK
jgi:3-hydroxyisobutyrate dehydrogenase-like beta-hydroxyacid dehydrogenase